MVYKLANISSTHNAGISPISDAKPATGKLVDVYRKGMGPQRLL